MVIRRDDLEFITSLQGLVTLLEHHGLNQDTYLATDYADLKIIDPLGFLRIISITDRDDVGNIIRTHFKENNILYLLITDFDRFIFVKRDLYPITKYIRFGFRKHHIGRTALDKMNALTYDSITSFEAIFEQKTVIDTFYAEYKKVRDHLITQIQGILCDADRTLYAQIILDRIMFLYFIQKKKFLNGDEHYLNNRLEVCTTPYEFFAFFSKLCFDALSKSPPSPEFTGIPYLNGGLFRKHDIELQYTAIQIPNTAFQTILTFFGNWNWYVDEHSDYLEENQISPEILGHIFEKTVNQRLVGAYYTPKKITDYMSDRSITQHIIHEFKSQHPISTVEEIFEDISLIPLLYTTLRDVRICDNACGSGAFLLAVEGYLTYLINRCIQTMRDHGTFGTLLADTRRFGGIILPPAGNITPLEEYAIKKEIIASNLYGVDNDAGAVEICRLRLWLSLISHITDVKDLEPLPNTEYHIMCGHSLLGFTKVTDLRPLDQFVGQDTLKQHLIQLSEIKKAYQFEIDPQRTQQLKDQINALTRNLRVRLTDLLCDQIQTPKEKITRIQLDTILPFHWALEFCEVFFGKRGGFDILIGNPPYVKEYTNKSAFDGLHNSPYYQGKMDLWYIFGCRALEILHTGGIHCYIATNNWITNAGATTFRDTVLEESTIHTFTDFGDYKVFENTDVQTMIYLLLKESPAESYTVRYSKNLRNQMIPEELDIFLYSATADVTMLRYPATIHPTQLKKQYIQFSTPTIASILEKMEQGTASYLSERELAQGIVFPQDFLNKANAKVLKNGYAVDTGIFALTSDELATLQLTEHEKTLIKPYFTTDELGRYFASPQNKFWLIYARSDMNRKIDQYPHIKHHINKFASILTSDFKPYGLHRARVERFFQGHKIISLRKCIRPTFTYCDFDAYVSQTFYLIKTTRWNLKYLTGLLNSKLIRFWLFHKGKMQGNNFQVDSAPIKKIPIHTAPDAVQRKVAEQVDHILTVMRDPNLDATTKTTIIQPIEDAIDSCIYNLYGIPDADRVLINANSLS